MECQHNQVCQCEQCSVTLRDIAAQITIEPALHIAQQPQVDIPAYSYYGDLSKRRYDLPERESGDWQGRP